MEVNEKEEECFFSSQTQNEIFWFQNNTGGVVFENKYYCIDSNHYVTQPNWIICEICNGIIHSDK